MPKYFAQVTSGPFNFRAKYIELLEIDGSIQLANDLLQLSLTSRQAVEQFLILNIDKARSLIGASAGSSVFSVHMHMIFTGMLKVEAAHRLVRWTMASAASLHRPAHLLALDGADLKGTPRYGPVHKYLMQQLELVESVIRCYREGALEERSTWSETSPPTLIASSDWMRPLRHKLRAMGLETLAQKLFVKWHSKLGDALPTFVERQICWIESKLGIMRARLEQSRPPIIDYNKRVANWKEGHEPLVLLYLKSRLVVAWINPADDDVTDVEAKGESSGTASQNGVDQVLEWLSRNGKRGEIKVDVKPFQPRQAALAAEVFTLLGFAIVEDDNMLPAKLPPHENEEGKLIQLKSQRDDREHKKRSFTFGELWNALYFEGTYYVKIYDDAGEIVNIPKKTPGIVRSSIIKKPKSGKYRTPDQLEGSLKVAFFSACEELLAPYGGLTVKGL